MTAPTKAQAAALLRDLAEEARLLGINETIKGTLGQAKRRENQWLQLTEIAHSIEHDEWEA